MPTINHRQAGSATLWQLGLALGLVYIVWGTTYFVIGVAVRTMPPLWMGATRFLAASTLMFAWAWSRGEALPTRRQWRNAALIGLCMACLAMNLVVLAQREGVGSGLMATVVTTMPMWLALWTRLGGEPVPWTSWLGLGFGAAGAALLSMERDFSAGGWVVLAAFGAPMVWSIGSYASRKLDLAAPNMAAAAQWLMGGLMSLALALVFEPDADLRQVGASTWLAWGYLVVFGTLLALNAYLWLLQNTSAALAGSYSFVNPAVALLVGVWIGREHVTGWVWLALPLIASALALILYGKELRAWLRSRSS